MNTTLSGFGVSLNMNILSIRASDSNFPQKKHNLLQAMLSVNDLFYLSSPNVSSLFHEDVIAWLEENEIRFLQNIKLVGKSGFDHMFDAAIPKSKVKPERIAQSINHPRKGSAEDIVFKWFDTKDARPHESKLYALLNDTDEKVQPSVINALKNYGLVPVPWSKKGEFLDELSA